VRQALLKIYLLCDSRVRKRSDKSNEGRVAAIAHVRDGSAGRTASHNHLAVADDEPGVVPADNLIRAAQAA
jgi:hypothetical protein